MRINKSVPFILVVMAAWVPAWGLDAPHNKTNNITCTNCHSAHTKSTVGYLLTTGTTIQSFCQSCHNGVRATYEVGHSTTTTGSTKYSWNKTCIDCHDPHSQRQWRSYYAQGALIFTGTVNTLTACRIVANGSPGWPSGYWRDFTLTFQGNPPPQNALSTQTATSFKITDATGGNTLWVRITDTCSTTYTPNTLLYWGASGSSFNIFYGRLVWNSIVATIAGFPATPTAVRFFTQAAVGPVWNTLSDNTPPYENEVCNTCHSQNNHHQRDGTAPGGQSHYDGNYCVGCHPHDKGFAPQESPGGLNCTTCHSDLFAALNDNTASSYHHYINNAAATYPVISQPVTMGGQADTNRRCLLCHADHNLFNPTINPASGGRGKNLRTSISTLPTTTTAYSFTNTDFVNNATTWYGGICLSCHNSVQYKSYTQPDDSRPAGNAWTPEIPFTGTVAAQVSAYDLSAHEYTATSSFSGSLVSTTAMDCVKCHNDTLSPKSNKNAQKSAVAFGLHDSTLRRMLSPFTIASYADPLEESFCYVCHTGGAAGNDYYNAASMSADARNIPLPFSRAYRHPIYSTRGYHYFTEGTASNWNPASGRHVQCEDCHNPHSVRPGAHVTGTSVAGPPLVGAWGVITSSTIGPFTNSGSTRFTNGSASVTGVGTNWLTSMAGWRIRNYDDPAGTWYTVQSVGSTTSLTLAANYTGPTTPASPYPGNPYIMLPNATFTRTDPVTYEPEVCFRCHSWYAYGNTPPMAPSQAPTTPFGTYQSRPESDIALDFTTTNYGYHPVFGWGRNQPSAGANTNWGTTSCADGSAGKRRLPGGTCDNTLSNTFVDGWYYTSTVTCSDCHGSSAAADPQGPHGSANRWVLKSADPNVRVTIRNGTVTYPNQVTVGGGTAATATPAIFCFNCHRRDVYGDFNLSGNTTYSVLSRINHDPSGNQNTYKSTTPNIWGIVCMECHGGDTLAGMHGSNKRKGPNVDPTNTKNTGGTPGSWSGRRLLNGATWFAVTRPSTTAAVNCWTKGASDAVSSCAHSHTGDSGNTANYDYESGSDP